MLRIPEPVLVLDLFPAEREALLVLLESLRADDWSRPTIAGSWTVKDIAAHLVADDLGRVSRQRDGHLANWVSAVEPLAAYVDRRNAEWVAAMRRLSPRVVRSLLEFSGRETQRLFTTMDPFALGWSVGWVGPDPAPNWLDMAREFTERWHHQQQIREAVGEPLLDHASLLGPVLATFAFALVPPFRNLDAPSETNVLLTVEGPAGGQWTVAREGGGWALRVGRTEAPTASVSMDQDTAWRMYVRALSPAEIAGRSRLEGDVRLAARILDAFGLVS